MEALKVAIADDNENMLKVLGQVIGQEQDLSVRRRMEKIHFTSLRRKNRMLFCWIL